MPVIVIYVRCLWLWSCDTRYFLLNYLVISPVILVAIRSCFWSLPTYFEYVLGIDVFIWDIDGTIGTCMYVFIFPRTWPYLFGDSQNIFDSLSSFELFWLTYLMFDM